MPFAAPTVPGPRSLVLALLLASALAGGCGKSDAPTQSDAGGEAAALVAQANAKLADILFAEFNSPDPQRPSDIDVRPALALYQRALALDPSNPGANFGIGVLNVIALTSDTEVNDAFDEWSNYLAARTPFHARADRRHPLGVPLFFEGGTGAMRLPFEILPMSVVAQQRALGAPDPQIGRVQAILRDRVIPRLAEARVRLGMAATPGFVFWVTPKMQGDLGADSVEVDRTDLLALKAATGLLQAACHTAVAYQLGMTAYDSLSLYQSLQQGSSWLSLVAGGATYVSSTDELLVGAIDDAEAAIDALLSETDPQDDDVIRLGPGGAAEAQGLMDDLETARSALGPGGTTIVDDWDQNASTPPVALDIALGAWFTNPEPNLKSLLPAYTATVERRPFQLLTHVDYSTVSVFPDFPSAGYYYAFVSIQIQDHGVVYSYSSGDPALLTVLQARLDLDVSAVEQEPDWTGNFSGTLSASAYVPGGGIWEIQAARSYSYTTATDHVFVPILHWDAATFLDWAWPDPTFHGVFPGIGSTAEFNQVFGIDGSGWTRDLVLDWTPRGFAAPGHARIPRDGSLRLRSASSGVREPVAPGAPLGSRRTR